MNAVLPTLALTGVTGSVGGMVAQQIADARRPQRLLARTPAKAPQLPRSSIHPFSFEDRDAAVEALTGVRTVFMVSAAENERRLDQHRAFVDAVAAAGVEHIVYTSFLAAAPDATFTLARDHFTTEEYIKGKGLVWTFLRDSLYIDFMSGLVGEGGVIRGPAGAGRVAAVTRADVAAVATTVLLDPAPHRNTTYDLTGPEALTMTEIAAILSAARKEPVTYYDETIDEAYESRAPWGAPAWQADAWVSTYTAIAAGELAEVSDDVEKVTGRKPTSLSAFLRSAG